MCYTSCVFFRMFLFIVADCCSLVTWGSAQVNVGEDEPEDVAVRKYMRKVMDSRLLEQVRRCA
jgi:hypothetical protein